MTDNRKTYKILINIKTKKVIITRHFTNVARALNVTPRMLQVILKNKNFLSIFDSILLESPLLLRGAKIEPWFTKEEVVKRIRGFRKWDKRRKKKAREWDKNGVFDRYDKRKERAKSNG